MYKMLPIIHDNVGATFKSFCVVLINNLHRPEVACLYAHMKSTDVHDVRSNGSFPLSENPLLEEDYLQWKIFFQWKSFHQWEISHLVEKKQLFHW